MMGSVEILTDVAPGDFPTEWYEIASPDHFWFDWRWRVMERQIEASGISKEVAVRALEIGCGHGVLRRQIEAFTRWTVDGCDLNMEGLSQNAPVRGRTLLYDIGTRTPSLAHAYDVVILYDIIEHIKDTDEFLKAALFHLKPHGALFINVPALNSMFSNYDRAVGHVRRYDRRSLTRALEPHGLRILDLRYWGCSMVPLLWLRSFQKSASGNAAEVIRKGLTPPNGTMNAGLKMLMHVETTLLSRPPLGTSLMAACTYDEGTVRG